MSERTTSTTASGAGPVVPGRGDQPGTTPPIHEVSTIWLDSLTATPGSLLPFQAATLAWQVHAEGPVRLELNGNAIPAVGSKVVTPQSSSVYRITAKTPRMTRELGRIEVTVDSRACTTYQPRNVLNVLEGAWETGLREAGGFTLTRPSEVRLADGRVHLKADFSFPLDPLPGNGDGHLRASFRVGVVDREVVAADRDIDIDLELPFWARPIPQTAPRIGLARIAARRSLDRAIDSLADLLGFLGMADEGFALVSARIAPGEGGLEGFICTACPTGPLERLVAAGDTLSGTLEPRLASQ